MQTDPIADMLTRIRNANRVERPVVDIPMTKFKAQIAQVLKDEGFIYDFQVGEMAKEGAAETFQLKADAAGKQAILRVYLKYGPEGERVIRHIQRGSKPGLRRYVRHTQLKPVLDGLGISILTTNRGVVSDRQAKAQRLGGELICTVW